MKSRRHVPTIISVGVICLAAMSIVAFAGSNVSVPLARQEAKADAQRPKIISKVKSLEVVNSIIEGQGADASVLIEVRNNSDKEIIAITLESGNDKDASGVTLAGFRSGDQPPAVVLKPHGTVKVSMSLSDARPGFPIRVAAVMYADGVEEGDELALNTMRRQKEHAKNAKKQGAPSQ